MSAEIWRSEVLLYGFMILNVLAVAAALAWAHRRGLLGGPDDPMTASLEPAHGIRSKENGDG
jgi:hypothetical protein